MGSIVGVSIAILLFGLGFAGVILRRDLVIKLLALGLVNGSTILCLVSLHYRAAALAPIMRGPGIAAYADPLPQALVLAAIVINFAILALALVFIMLLVERYHTTDARRIEHELEKEEGR
jgi:multicomponent Na+:H+ antiporter subunit C